jgi:hypothetical protein
LEIDKHPARLLRQRLWRDDDQLSAVTAIGMSRTRLCKNGAETIARLEYTLDEHDVAWGHLDVPSRHRAGEQWRER